MKKKTFDCVEMQDKAGAEIYEETKDMTFEEQLAYWKEQDRLLVERREQARAKRQTA